jgi:predicted nucleotidyltransferase
MLAREGELIRTENQVIFDVKGLVHPPNRLIAFPRYIPSPEGNRRGEKGLYGKIYSFSERFQFLERNMPDLIVHDPVFDATLCEVPVDTVVERYDPIEKLKLLRTSKELSELERKVVHLAEELQGASGIPWSSIGISGSVLTGLTTLQSDVDPVVYGLENGCRAYEALEALLDDNTAGFKRYRRGELQALFDFRSKDTIMGFEDFARVERRKAFQGMYEGTDYFIRFVKDWSQVTEQYGDVCYKNAGYAKITATIADDSEALFTPCTYGIEDVTVAEGAKLEPIREIVSFRGRFCEQAKTGEAITAQGKVELVTDKRSSSEYYRLILGNKPEDYMVLSR